MSSSKTCSCPKFSHDTFFDLTSLKNFVFVCPLLNFIDVNWFQNLINLREFSFDARNSDNVEVSSIIFFLKQSKNLEKLNCLFSSSFSCDHYDLNSFLSNFRYLKDLKIGSKQVFVK